MKTRSVFVGVIFSLVFSVFCPVSMLAQETVYLSNLAGSTSVNNNVSANSWYAQQFVTGGNPYGYTLDSVGLDMNGGGGNLFFVYLYTDNGGAPGTLVQSLTGATSPGSGVNTYTATNLWLAPSRSYWVVASDINISGYFWNFTSDGYTSADGWSLGASAVSADYGQSWSSGLGNTAQLK